MKNTVSTIQRRSCWIEEEESISDDEAGNEANKFFRIDKRYWINAS